MCVVELAPHHSHHNFREDGIGAGDAVLVRGVATDVTDVLLRIQLGRHVLHVGKAAHAAESIIMENIFNGTHHAFGFGIGFQVLAVNQDEVDLAHVRFREARNGIGLIPLRDAIHQQQQLFLRREDPDDGQVLVSCGNGVLQVSPVIEHGHSEHHVFVIQILKQVLAVGVDDVSRELEAGVQKSVGVVAHQHGIPVVDLAVAPRAAAQAAANWRTAFRYAAIAWRYWSPQDTHCWVTWALHLHIYICYAPP